MPVDSSELTPRLLRTPRASANPLRPRLPALEARARKLIVASLEGIQPGSLVLIACSGGADSLALASVAAYFQRTGQFQVGGVVIDHQLHPTSAEVSARTARVMEELGLAPVRVERAQVQDGGGPEAAARSARYAALAKVADELGAAVIALAHTLDDQAEQVLLGLARGSGTRSLAGMPARRSFSESTHQETLLIRPFLALRRTETEQLCELAGVVPWQDPSNTNPEFARNRVRHQVLPVLESQIGPGVAESLARTAQILSYDAEFIEGQAEQEFSRLVEQSSGRPGELTLDSAGVRALPVALRQRVLRLAVTALGAPAPSFERLSALESLLENRGSAGPIQLPGHVQARRLTRTERLELSEGTRLGPVYGKLVLARIL